VFFSNILGVVDDSVCSYSWGDLSCLMIGV